MSSAQRLALADKLLELGLITTTEQYLDILDAEPLELQPRKGYVKEAPDGVKCTCPIHDLMRNGCTCQGFAAEQARKGETNG
jgi:hypothetical protein